ncbi:PetM family cytochrome b6-f complex subunit 7, partial [Plectonema radiosum NIES-515]
LSPVPSPSGRLSLYRLTIRNRRTRPMSEIVAAALLPNALIFIGWGLGVLLLKIQGAEPE